MNDDSGVALRPYEFGPVQVWMFPESHGFRKRTMSPFVDEALGLPIGHTDNAVQQIPAREALDGQFVWTCTVCGCDNEPCDEVCECPHPADVFQPTDIGFLWAALRARSKPAQKLRRNMAQTLPWRTLQVLMPGISLLDVGFAILAGDDSPPPRRSVYAVRMRGHIKIGIATDVKARISSIQSSSPSPLTIIRVWPDLYNAAEVERLAHQYFAEWRLRGEWFRDHPGFIEALEWLVDQCGVTEWPPSRHKQFGLRLPGLLN